MSTAEHKAIYRRVVAAINRGDADELDAFLDVNLVDHNPIPDQTPGRIGFKQWMAAARSSFPDLHGTIEDVLGDGDRVAGRVTWRGTHRGVFAGVAPTGKQVTFTVIHIVRFADGKIMEWWGVADLLGVMQQLGERATGEAIGEAPSMSSEKQGEGEGGNGGAGEGVDA